MRRSRASTKTGTQRSRAKAATARQARRAGALGYGAARRWRHRSFWTHAQIWRLPDAGRGSGALWIAGGLGGLSLSLTGAAGALLVRQLTGNDSLAGLPQSLLVVGYAIAAIGISQMTTRIGRSKALAVGLLAATAGCAVVLLGTLVTRLSLVLIGSGLLGAGNAGVMLGRYAAAELTPHTQPTKAIGRFLAATTLGAVTGPNLLSPTATVAKTLDLPGLAGPYLIAGVGFTAAAALLGAGGVVTHPPRPPDRWVRDSLTGVHRAGIAVLAIANTVMVAVMTMAPLQLDRDGSGLAVIGLVISVHIAGMYAPSPASAWLTTRIGAARAALTATSILALACLLAALAANQQTLLAIAMAAVGVGWNLSLLSGSVMLTTATPASDRPRREGLGEASMGLAAAGGGSASGVIMTSCGSPTLAALAAITSALLLPLIPRPKVPVVK
jgi:MFS family permease